MKEIDREILGNAMGDLLSLVRRLRGPNGCPWDAKQNNDSIKIYLIEEAYEVLDAIENDSPSDILGELGDLLFQILFLSALAEEKGQFDFVEVVDKIHSKMVRRHPHVFSNVKVSSEKEVADNWAKIKRNETDASNPVTASLRAVPSGLPALLRTYRLSERAAKIGFDWSGRSQIWKKVLEETEELARALEMNDRQAVKEEIGDLFFSLVNLSRHWNMNPEDLLRSSNRKFVSRFERMEILLKKSGISLEKATAGQMNAAWEAAKREA